MSEEMDKPGKEIHKLGKKTKRSGAKYAGFPKEKEALGKESYA